MILSFVSITSGNSFIALPCVSELLEHDFPTDPSVKEVITAPMSPMVLRTPPSAMEQHYFINNITE